MARSSSEKIILAVVALAAGTAAFTTVSAAAGSAAPNVSTASPRVPRIATMPVVGDTLSANAWAAIKRRAGSFTPVTSLANAKISKSDALKRAGVEFGFLNDAEGVSAQLGMFTDGKYGRQLESDPAKPSRIDPLIKDRLVWLVEVKGFTMPVMGPLPRPGSTVKANDLTVTGGADGLFVIDASSGKFLSGDQYSAYPQDNVGD